MSDEKKVGNLEVEPLHDEDLEEVAGGVDDCSENSCSKGDCSGGGDDTIRLDPWIE